ncbi:MAG: hypothetical protein M1830_004724 [Pleopsidium flavum]|nr:MAG: hypothetical protein M1830_004724 [Pleopsidium flavum]
MSLESKEYELVLFGATGYTGRLCAEHITTNLPTDLRWAVAGRSTNKLSALVQEIKPLNPDRLQPRIESVELSKVDLINLARKTRLLINTVGPYHMYGTPVVEACANNGTHYLDVTGESPWVLEMIRKYHETAKANGAIMIPEIGIESAPADLVSWSLASLIRDQLSVGTKEIVMSIHDMNGAPSGGTIATVLGILDFYSLKDVMDSTKAWALSPTPGPKSVERPSLVTRFLGVRNVPDLGTLTTSISGGANRAIVHRSWGLMGGNSSLYGPRFHFNEYVKVRNAFIGVAVHFMIAVGMMALALPPIRWLLRKLVYAPGQGPTREVTSKERIEYRAIAIADQDTSTPKRAFAKMRYNGGLYYLTGVFLAEAAITILRDDTLPKKLGGGILTPAMLGQPFVDRLRKAGLILETQLLAD